MIPETVISTLVANLSYLGVLAASTIVSMSIVFPLPWYPIALGAVIFKLNPILTSLMFAIGSMIGEIMCYYIGIGGGKVVSDKFKDWKKSKRLVKLVKLVKKLFKRHGFLTVFITSFLIFPFDIISIIAGANRYSLKRYLIAGTLGKFFKMLIVIILTTKGITYLGYLM